MKKNSGMFFGLPCRRAGAVLLVLRAFTTSSHADVAIVNNTGTPDNNLPIISQQQAQTFTPSSSATIGSLSLQLNIISLSGGTASAVVELYTFTGSGNGDGNNGLSFTDLGQLGTVNATSTGDQQVLGIVPLNGSILSLNANQQYAIGLMIPSSGSIGWDFTSTTGSGSATVGDTYNYNSSSSTWFDNGPGAYFQLDLEPVPEIPMTGIVMGFGVLAIAAGHTLRRKFRPVVSCNA
jgi:hypothetical protein